MKRAYIVIVSALMCLSMLIMGGGNCGYRLCGEVDSQVNCQGQSYGGRKCEWDSELSVCRDIPLSCKPDQSACQGKPLQNCGTGANVGICAVEGNVCVVNPEFNCAAIVTPQACTQGTNPCKWSD